MVHILLHIVAADSTVAAASFNEVVDAQSECHGIRSGIGRDGRLSGDSCGRGCAR
jgi:hypothetical protein